MRSIAILAAALSLERPSRWAGFFIAVVGSRPAGRLLPWPAPMLERIFAPPAFSSSSRLPILGRLLLCPMPRSQPGQHFIGQSGECFGGDAPRLVVGDRLAEHRGFGYLGRLRDRRSED